MENNKEFVEETTENVEAQTTEEMEETEVEEQVEDTDDSEEVDSEEEVEVPELEETAEETNEAETTENVEEAQEKMFTSEEVDNIKKRYKKRLENKLRKEYDKKYSRLENVVNAGLGTNNVDDATEKLTEFYEENGIKIPSSNSTQKFTDDEI